ncbi:unnamed protein product [Didymodactylos carnosus]|uniref:Uncharacterized protein n=1 Tax=Didymodactylos carnosus TaxID=1234261 RepID=A0A814U3U5_9BILA|nr:unnamed protein product [Didymodactylos carnosus]CAF3933242.1 unnamed protein product [Didymodactylos carnosus]
MYSRHRHHRHAFPSSHRSHRFSTMRNYARPHYRRQSNLFYPPPNTFGVDPNQNKQGFWEKLGNFFTGLFSRNTNHVTPQYSGVGFVPYGGYSSPGTGGGIFHHSGVGGASSCSGGLGDFGGAASSCSGGNSGGDGGNSLGGSSCGGSGGGGGGSCGSGGGGGGSCGSGGGGGGSCGGGGGGGSCGGAGGGSGKVLKLRHTVFLATGIN